MENAIITTTGNVIDVSGNQSFDYVDVLLALRMLQHARKWGWSIAEANDLYRGLKMMKVGLPFNLADNASKKLILHYLKNHIQAAVDSDIYDRNELTYSDGVVTLGLPYVFNIPFQGEEGRKACDAFTNLVTSKIRDKIVEFVKSKSNIDHKVAAAKVDSMLTSTDSFVHSPTTDVFSPLGVSAYECPDGFNLIFTVMQLLDFGQDQTPDSYKKLYEVSHEVLTELTQTESTTTNE